MRLINTSTLCLEEFATNPPPYAILSHTWGNEEVRLEDMRRMQANFRDGYKKLIECCRLAASQGYCYCWIDTCCIDKSSSAELSETINSMFAYYSSAGICYVLLEDVQADDGFILLVQLRQARWIHRGWTLQELIAPYDVHFYDKNWTFCGDRKSMAERLHAATNIDRRALVSQYLRDRDPSTYSIAVRMSWASLRQTTRPEDMAYCLFGIFDVNLPPLYGEGARAAFRRLQEEIIRTSMDFSFLAWSSHLGSQTSSLKSSVLARGPDLFYGVPNIVTSPTTQLEPFQMTNKGLRVRLPVLQVGVGERIVILRNCYIADDQSTKHPVGVRMWERSVTDGLFYRRRHGPASDVGALGELCVLDLTEFDWKSVRPVSVYLAIRDRPNKDALTTVSKRDAFAPLSDRYRASAVAATRHRAFQGQHFVVEASSSSQFYGAGAISSTRAGRVYR